MIIMGISWLLFGRYIKEWQVQINTGMILLIFLFIYFHHAQVNRSIMVIEYKISNLSTGDLIVEESEHSSSDEMSTHYNRLDELQQAAEFLNMSDDDLTKEEYGIRNDLFDKLRQEGSDSNVTD